MIRYQREYGAEWGASKKAASGQPSQARGGGEGWGGVAAIMQPAFYRGLEVALYQGELCFKTLGSNLKWVLLSSQPG